LIRAIITYTEDLDQIHPLSGQGGNNAIISAAHLANQLKHFTQHNMSSDEASLNWLFREYKRTREPQTRELMQMSHLLQRMEALETPLLRLFELKYVCQMPIEALSGVLARTYTQAVSLNYLPPPPRHCLVPFNEEVALKPRARFKTVTAFWLLVLALVVFGQQTIPWVWKDVVVLSSPTPMILQSSLIAPSASMAYQRAMSLYFNLSLTTVISIMWSSLIQ
jgi:hypothetical protein